MEIFIDFGLFELLLALGIAALSRLVYSSRFLAFPFMVASFAAPVTMIVLASSHFQRWVAVTCLSTAAVNIAAIAAVIQNGEVPRLTFRRFVRKQQGKRSGS